MIVLRESGTRPVRSAPRRARTLSLAVFGLLALSGATEARSLQAAPARTAVDTLGRGVPQHFRKTVFFNTPYLTRAAEVALERYRQPEIEISLDPPSEGARAAAYARRFGISKELATKILETAQAEGLDPELGFRLVRVESHFKTQARGPAGALGLTQLMPSTARSVDRSMKTEKEILEPTRNLRVGFRYLRQMIERYDGDVRLGLLAYNRGEVAVDRALRRGQDPENGYSHKVLGTKGSNPYKGKGLLTDSDGKPKDQK